MTDCQIRFNVFYQILLVKRTKYVHFEAAFYFAAPFLLMWVNSLIQFIKLSLQVLLAESHLATLISFGFSSAMAIFVQCGNGTIFR